MDHFLACPGLRTFEFETNSLKYFNYFVKNEITLDQNSRLDWMVSVEDSNFVDFIDGR